jgi:hypothetical protein
MKNFETTNDYYLAKRKAYNLIFSSDYIIMGRNPLYKLDMRYKFDKMCKEIIIQLLPTIDRNGILYKQKLRKIAKTIEVNNVHNFWKNRPFFKDIVYNKCIRLGSSFIQDGQRHHHCKNYVDHIILDTIRIIRRNQPLTN